jgi:hypothetical protein
VAFFSFGLAKSYFLANDEFQVGRVAALGGLLLGICVGFEGNQHFKNYFLYL